ncbi:uncharacterized protein NECHADRAFT_81417 [Fusarium vanettenii 77-13-4]|uniref:Uncharacterized protein n=1 Tax=Fusarium vanettenii (strain ATCC MYA-4622 / CBS 123669 / FGSC 9596 / NRRL 45880 / 77-13-4) TaxID=660122 RepID=C7Z8G2_FUSV7|nr:uncharacterized protein NECHADRAFT_81417 [Fusarium vanettenii 77-13-4]EEU39331.1 predicted protein [Fusarium vanettenii 77-13-4]
MNNTNNSQSSPVPAVPHQLNQSQPSATTADHSPARLVNTNQTVTANQRSVSQLRQRWQLLEQQYATDIQTLASARVTAPAPATQATPALASMPQARNIGWARTFNRRVLAGRHVTATFYFDRNGDPRGYLYQHDEFILGPVNEWGGVASGYGLFPI